MLWFGDLIDMTEFNEDDCQQEKSAYGCSIFRCLRNAYIGPPIVVHDKQKTEEH